MPVLVKNAVQQEMEKNMSFSLSCHFKITCWHLSTKLTIITVHYLVVCLCFSLF